jgi:hypothetical protein
MDSQPVAPPSLGRPKSGQRFRFTIKQLLVAILIFSVVLAVWLGWFREAVIVRPPTSNAPVLERYFGIDDPTSEIRNIAVVEGVFTKSTWLSGALYLVRAGKVEEVNAFTVGRSPNRLGEPYWLDMTITLALGNRKTPNGCVTLLGSAGQTRGGGRAANIPHQVPNTP